MLIDSHCHIDAPEFDADRDDVIARSLALAVRAFVLPSVARENFETVMQIAARHPQVVYALGIHPLYTDRAQESDLQALRLAIEQKLSDRQLIAIGEIGLDFFVPGLDRDRQLYFYEQQLQIAHEFELPVILHVRRAQDQILKYLRRARLSGGIAHAFNGSQQQAEAFLKLNFVLGFGGAMTFSRALQIRRLATTLPPEAHVLETDAPDISPSWLHPVRNTPSEIPRIAAVLAELRAIGVDQCATVTATNLKRVLPRLEAALRFN